MTDADDDPAAIPTANSAAAPNGDSAAPAPGAARPRPVDWGDEEVLSAAAPAGPSPAGRYPVAALVLLAVGAAALWGSSRLTWVTVTSADGLTEPRTDELNGGVWFGALTPLALVLLAAIAAVVATRGWVRRIVGVLVALIAAVTAVPALALLTGSGATEQRAATLAELPGRADVQELATAPLPALLTLAGALAAFGAGLLLARMPAGAKGLSGKYDSPGARKAAATEAVAHQSSGGPLPERVLWDALDAGADPTDSVRPGPGTVTSDDAPGAPETTRGSAAGPAGEANRPDTARKPGASDSDATP
ncbi:TIGR02234 family membrane protein [Nocardia sp. NBC_00416]|uniref:TIGR02234 family membrane protein n=1 Tax=Nocardia sp. NBC_00416 TaxID=2975991 RepID=UPI002E1D3820